MIASGDSGWSDRMLLQVAAGLIVCTPILMIAAREIPATILVIVSLSLIVVAVRTGNTRAILDDLRLRHADARRAYHHWARRSHDRIG